MEFIYCNARNEIKVQRIENVSISEHHYQGICKSEGRLKTYRKDRVIEMLSGKENIEERLDYHLKNPPPLYEAKSRVINNQGKLEVCFTGFKSNDKFELIKLAEINNIFVRSAVTKKLDFLCCGYNAGPTKIENARHQGVVILTEHQFRELLETGEVPEEQ